MSDTYWRDREDGVVPERLMRYVDDLLASHRTRTEIEDELISHGIDRETAAHMITRSLGSQWIQEGGGGPALGRLGPRHMIAGAALFAVGLAATFGSAYFAATFDSNVSYLFYGAIGAGAIDFAYGLIRVLQG